MAWGFARNTDKRPELERLAAEAEAIFAAMPLAARQQVHDTIAAIAAAGEGLKVLPEAMGAVLLKIVMRFFQERVMPVGRPAVRAQLECLTRGAPLLLGPYERHVDAIAKEAA